MKESSIQKTLQPGQQSALLGVLRERFERHPQRHIGLEWHVVQARLIEIPGTCWSLDAMEQSGGEPDVVSWDAKTQEIVFMDCSPESPSGRRSLCYDRAGLESRKEHKPMDSAMDMARSMGIELLTEEQYQQLQGVGKFDNKTSSWLVTPPDIRASGGALFGDRRYGRVFTYHNGAQSYYAARGFRGSLRIALGFA